MLFSICPLPKVPVQVTYSPGMALPKERRGRVAASTSD